jgi:hypothetical protein
MTLDKYRSRVDSIMLGTSNHHNVIFIVLSILYDCNPSFKSSSFFLPPFLYPFSCSLFLTPFFLPSFSALGTKQIQSVNSALATLEGQAARINDFLQLNSLTGMTGRNKHLRPLSLLDHLSDLKIMIGTKQDKLKGL